MTPIAQLLTQKRALCLHAFEQTRDLNEAYFLVHGVMTHALSRAGDSAQDLDSAMAHALDARTQRLARREASA